MKQSIKHLLESAESFKDFPNTVKKILSISLTGAGEKSEVSEFKVETTTIKNRSTFTSVLKKAIADNYMKTSFVIESNGKSIAVIRLVGIEYLLYKADSYKPVTAETIPQSSIVVKTKQLIADLFDGDFDKALEGQGLVIKKVFYDEERGKKQNLRSDLKKDDKRFARPNRTRSELTAEERRRLSDKMKKD